MTSTDYKIFEAADVPLQRGMTLPRARLAYKTYGTLTDDKSNVILYPTSYGAQHYDTEWLIGPGRVLDPDRYFIIIPNMLGNGLSTSPSNIGAPFGPERCPQFTHWDNVHLQKRLLEEVFAIEHLALIYGWSMGAQQALHWGALFPDRVARICAVCGTARTSVHNAVFLQSLRATLQVDAAWDGTRFTQHPVRGLRAFGRVYAGWAMSQAFYRQRLYEQAGFSSLEDFVVRFWEALYVRRDPHDLLSSIETWLASDISDNEVFAGDLDKALGAITARTIMMPARTDLYFRAKDAKADAAGMPNAEFRVLDTDWGHRGGNPTWHAPDEAALRQAVTDLLSQ